MMLAIGLLMIGFGAYRIYLGRGHSPTGFMFAGVGAIILPSRWARLIGGVALGGLAIWLLIKALGPFDYLLAAIAGLSGFGAVKQAAAEFGWGAQRN